MGQVVIVGGGASGLAAGIFAARNKHKVAILEHKDKIGKKILATGNGKCNYTNYVQNADCYRGDDSDFAMQVLSKFNVSETIDFFNELGIYPKEKNGYVYPNSEQASSVLEVLRLELKRLKVSIECETRVEYIQYKNEKFIIKTNKGNFTSDRVIVATGGCATPNLGSDGSGYQLAKELGHTIIKPIPALVQLKSSEKYFKTIAGVRTEANIKLFISDQYVAQENGELLIANYGVSGIPIFQISRYASKAISDRKKVSLQIDLLPNLDWSETNQLLINRMKKNMNNTTEESLIGLFNNKLAYVMLNEAGISPTLPCKNVDNKMIKKLVQQIKEWKIPITEPNSFEQAQVSAGGVSTRELSPDTLESKIVKGLYITGELLDIDGTCGGYNLQWAWSTGAIAGSSIK